MSQGPYGQEIESAETYLANRLERVSQMAKDELLHEQAIALQVSANKYGYGYQQLWCGVPIIRLPDDIMLIQEIIFELKPSCVVETGIARAGSLLLNASLMEIAGIPPAVLGIDIQIFPHAREVVETSRYAMNIQLFESDSTSEESVQAVRQFVIAQKGHGPVLLVLDSNHVHSHVLKELTCLTPLLPSGSITIVADTIVESMPSHLYENRPWGQGNNPLTALHEFLKNNHEWEVASKWRRRGLLSEFHDGVIQKL
jgi:cephalosporin hydroxylase